MSLSILAYPLGSAANVSPSNENEGHLGTDRVHCNDREDHHVDRDRSNLTFLDQPLHQGGNGLADGHQVGFEHVFEPPTASHRLVLQDPPEIRIRNVRLVKYVDEVA